MKYSRLIRPPLSAVLAVNPRVCANTRKSDADEARSLKAYGELPETAKINETDTYNNEDNEGIGFEFDEDRDESDGAKEIDVDEIWDHKRMLATIGRSFRGQV